jgi:hypothetical protein
MSETVISIDTLSAHLLTLIHTAKVKIRDDGKNIILIPIENPYEAIESIRGICKSDGHSVDRFMARKQEEKEFEL